MPRVLYTVVIQYIESYTVLTKTLDVIDVAGGNEAQPILFARHPSLENP